jgi:hypothetical protein
MDTDASTDTQPALLQDDSAPATNENAEQHDVAAASSTTEHTEEGETHTREHTSDGSALEVVDIHEATTPARKMIGRKISDVLHLVEQPLPDNGLVELTGSTKIEVRRLIQFLSIYFSSQPRVVIRLQMYILSMCIY